MDIIIMHQTVANHDAIGNDIEAMYLLLSKEHNCYVYAQNQFNKTVRYIDRQGVFDIIQQEDCVVIYHHSVFWAEGYMILKHVKGKVIFRYHNITPPEFFQNYNQFHYHQCSEGRKQTERLISEFKDAFWISDSVYNTRDLIGVEKERQAICPPFHKIEQLGKKVPDEQILRHLLESDTINLLFVGRVAPNKGHLMLLEILRIFCKNYREKIKLRIIGKFDEGLPAYNDQINQYIKIHNLEESIEFVGEINDSTLMSYYLGSDVLICTSEHEGFCVPIIEAQYFELPVVALNECVISETLGKKQLVLEKKSELFAAAIHLLLQNQQYREYLIYHGKQNFIERFTYDIISGIFMEAFKKGIGKNT